jgi:hypothetical protein
MELKTKIYTNHWFSQNCQIGPHNQDIITSFVRSLGLISRQPLRRIGL